MPSTSRAQERNCLRKSADGTSKELSPSAGPECIVRIARTGSTSRTRPIAKPKVGTIFSGRVSVHRKFSSAPVSNLWKYGSSVAFILTVATLWLSFGNRPNSRNDPLSVLEAGVIFGFWFAVIALVRWIWITWPHGSKSQDSQDLHK